MQSIFYSLQVRHVRISIVQIAWNNGHILAQTTFFMHLSFRNLWTVALLLCGATKMVPKKMSHNLSNCFKTYLFVTVFFLLSKMTAQLVNNAFLSVDNFAKEKLKKNDYTPKMSHNLSRRFENLFVFRFFYLLLFYLSIAVWKDDLTWNLTMMGQNTFWGCVESFML